MGLFNSFFGKKIVLPIEVKQVAEQLITNDWFRNCGNEHNLNLLFEIEQVTSLEEIDKKLAYKRDVREFTTLYNLMLEAGRRGSLFLSRYHNKEKEATWDRVTSAIQKEYISSYRFDFDKIESKFIHISEINSTIYFRMLFIDILKEVYYKTLFDDYPAFWIHILDVYLKGHVVVGWVGKFPSDEIQVKDILPISPKDGKLNIW